jgi:glutamate 5-kinase
MRVVIKLGSNSITEADRSLDGARIKRFVDEIAAVLTGGDQVVLVSSGAIAAGMGKLGITTRPETVREKQALAAVGQPLLMDAYARYAGQAGLTVAQVLLTRQDFDDRARYLNARNTLLTLLELKVIPVINENDTVAVDEIKFGENDTLAALVAAGVNADLLVMFTDVDGLYSEGAGRGELIGTVADITRDIERCASDHSDSGKGTGGMKTKIAAARIAVAAGVAMVIANGGTKGLLGRIMAGDQVGTRFLPKKPMEARKCWIAFGRKACGRIVIDQGAARALTDGGKSLLPSGVSAVEGAFKAGDAVSVVTAAGAEVARGLSAYSSEDLARIKRKKTNEIQKLFGAHAPEEVIHRDNLVIL